MISFVSPTVLTSFKGIKRQKLAKYDGTNGALTHFCVLTTTGRVACSGYNGYGNLGNGNTAYSTLPVAVLR